ncbi:hypothetical protein [Jannaschia sp. LMIT008]|uniref:hypothetical protein n=1 Tax=Jannaschia maritima TaxID=3032585 RepID=UPI0028118C46|nr:hypothetical protein [Jannaschia sp. LMIT008]
MGDSDVGQLHRKHEFDMPVQGSVRAKKAQARAIKRVLDPRTRKTVGWLYEWNTGQVSVMWKDGRRENVVYE